MTVHVAEARRGLDVLIASSMLLDAPFASYSLLWPNESSFLTKEPRIIEADGTKLYMKTYSCTIVLPLLYSVLRQQEKDNLNSVYEDDTCVQIKSPMYES